VRFCVVAPAIVRFPGERVSDDPVLTSTCVVPGVNPLADAVTVADPRLPPVTFG
jgi:hypothetical protein